MYPCIYESLLILQVMSLGAAAFPASEGKHAVYQHTLSLGTEQDEIQVITV